MLIRCRECGKKISDQANACPYCGCPQERQHTATGSTYHEIKKKKIILIVAGIILSLISAVLVFKVVPPNIRDDFAWKKFEWNCENYDPIDKQASDEYLQITKDVLLKHPDASTTEIFDLIDHEIGKKIIPQMILPVLIGYGLALLPFLLAISFFIRAHKCKMSNSNDGDFGQDNPNGPDNSGSLQ